ncbi:MAG TPA: HlyD family efflux transporter periplasmic adaptor subunit [Gammaproteobacteria bacterium]|nr:HlyD family efflux transporter periplasmic adaptor subunit [Gammaproteobacteria bacterium]
MRRRLIFLAVILLAAGAGAAWWLTHRPPVRDELTLYGNVDLRQVSLAFNGSERIAAVLAQEGDHVRQGDVVAKLDTSRLEPRVDQAKAEVEAQRAVVERMHNGSRPEEIAQARANVASAQADAVNARLQYRRLAALVSRKLASQQEVDSAKAEMDAAAARAVAAQKALDLLVAGPRREDVAQAEAQLRASEAQLALFERQLADAVLVAPLAAVVRTRLLEPGDMASPQTPVLSLAIVDPKWVRAYVSEADLGRVRPGLAAWIEVDSFPGRRFEGRIGFVSPVAEFTPKTVQTQELRTSLVYEVRVFVDDASDELRLGMPATVHVRFNQSVPAGAPRGESSLSSSNGA